MGGAHSTHGKNVSQFYAASYNERPVGTVTYTSMLWSTKRRVMQSRSAVTSRTIRNLYLGYPTTHIAV